MAETSPFAVLGVPEDAPLDVCARALGARLAALASLLVACHAEDRPAPLAEWAALRAAWGVVSAPR